MSFRRSVALLSALVAGSTALASCRESVLLEPAGGAPVLVGVTVAFADSVFVTLARPESQGTASPEPGAELVVQVGAELRIGLDEGPRDACGRPTGSSCYRARLGGQARPGDTVRLEGTLASGERLRGRAVVPSVPLLQVGPFPRGDTVRGRSLSDGMPAPELFGVKEVEGRVSAADTVVTATVWAAGAARSCPVRLPGPPPGIDLRRGRRVGVWAAPPDCSDAPGLVWDSMAVPVTFLAYDENFTAWAAGESHRLPEGEGAFGLEGVPGVWGAAVPRTFVLVLTP